MKVIVNDVPHDVADATTVAQLLDRLGHSGRGIAVAIDLAVLPRSQWHRALADGARLEIVTAVQGG